MLKLTRLNRSLVAVNPDQILWVEASPDTTLHLVNGERLLVRESVDDVMREFIEVKRQIHEEPEIAWPSSTRSVRSTSSLPPIPSLRSLPPADVVAKLTALRSVSSCDGAQALFAIVNEESTS